MCIQLFHSTRCMYHRMIILLFVATVFSQCSVNGRQFVETRTRLAGGFFTNLHWLKRLITARFCSLLAIDFMPPPFHLMPLLSHIFGARVWPWDNRSIWWISLNNWRRSSFNLQFTVELWQCYRYHIEMIKWFRLMNWAKWTIRRK